MPFMLCNQLPLFFQLRRSTKAKRLQIRSLEHYFEVVAPPKLPNRLIIAFVAKQLAWMTKQRCVRSQQQSQRSSWPAAFLAGEELLFRDQLVKLLLNFAAYAPPALLSSGCLVVTVPWQTPCGELARVVQQQVINWYKQQTRLAIESSVATLCPQLGRWPAGIGLKQQKTRWGSCGIHNKIYFNWLLILAPIGVLEYVVAHELCHLFYRHHGRRFWAKVASCYPNYQLPERWLRRHGHQLLAIEISSALPT